MVSTPASGLAVQWILTKREFVRTVRQPSRIVAAIATPALIWIVLASGFADSFAPPGADGSYGAFLVPGMAVMVVVFGSVFGAIALIEDKREGFLQGVMVGPAPRWAIGQGKLVAASLITWLQGLVVLLLALPYSHASIGGWWHAALVLGAVSFGVNGLALAFAWRMNSVAGFHGVMNLVLMPMWLLSGSVFPRDGAAGWMGAVMSINPLTHCTEAIRAALTGTPPNSTQWAATLFVAAAGVALATLSVPKRRL